VRNCFVRNLVSGVAVVSLAALMIGAPPSFADEIKTDTMAAEPMKTDPMATNAMAADPMAADAVKADCVNKAKMETDAMRP
jgi:pentapeptide MXKDX repeat protein